MNDMNWGKKTNAIPLSYYFLLVLMFLSVNVLNNYALNFHIPLPLHMIFRSGSLIANLVLGKLRCSRVCCRRRWVVTMVLQLLYMANYELILSLFPRLAPRILLLKKCYSMSKYMAVI